MLRAVTRGWNGYRNKSRHRKLTLEKNILPPLFRDSNPPHFYHESAQKVDPREENVSRRSYGDSNPGPLDHESDALTAEPPRTRFQSCIRYAGDDRVLFLFAFCCCILHLGRTVCFQSIFSVSGVFFERDSDANMKRESFFCFLRTLCPRGRSTEDSKGYKQKNKSKQSY